MKTANIASAVAAALIGLASVSAHALTVPSKLLGVASTPEQATRTVALTSATASVDVKYGETVSFDSGGRVFAIKFDGTRGSFDLNQLAPAGSLDHTVKVYVSPRATDERSL